MKTKSESHAQINQHCRLALALLAAPFLLVACEGPPDKFGTLMMCKEIYVCSDTPNPRQVVESHVCGVCWTGIF